MLKKMLCGILLPTLIAGLAGCDYNEFFDDVLSNDGDVDDGGILPELPDDQGTEMADDPGVKIDPDEETVSTENPDLIEDSEQ